MNRRLMLAYAWGKWIALRRADYEKAMEFYKSERLRGNWGILVHDDEMALQYQRCDFRVKRACRAVGVGGLVGYASLFTGDTDNGTVKVAGVDMPAKIATQSEVDQMNFDSFQRHERGRAIRAKQLTADKRHPLALWQDHCAEEEARAYEAELMSMRY